jgi:lambda family phage portal protein
MSGKVELNGFERMISYLSPKTALERAHNRARLEMWNGLRGYDAGKKSKSTDGWVTIGGESSNGVIKRNIEVLVSRSRDLERNNPYATKAVSVIANNVVGTGIRPSIPKDTINQAQEKKLMGWWRSNVETTKIDFNGQFGFYGLTWLAWRAAVESGNSFLRRVWDPESAMGFEVQLLEFDFLDLSKDGQQLDTGNFIILGIEFNRRGKRVAYWMFDKHPGETLPLRNDNLLSKRVPAEDIIHLYEVLRPGQVIGVPRGVAAFLTLKDLDNYEDAQLKRQVIAACFSVFIRKNAAGDYERAKDNTLIDKLEPGLIQELQPGEEISFASPPGTEGYEPYTRSQIRKVACAYLVTYESISGDLSNVNFSSYRAGWIEAHKQVQKDQAFTVVGMLCQPFWGWFMQAARLKGYNGDMLFAANWTPPRREMIDPLKEIEGLVAGVRAGIYSRSDVIRQLGNDEEKVFDEIMKEQEEADKAGMMLYSDAKHDPARVNFGKAAYLAKGAKSAVKPASKSVKKVQ